MEYGKNNSFAVFPQKKLSKNYVIKEGKNDFTRIKFSITYFHLCYLFW